MRIRVLSKETIDRIAAGEVVERPLNVVKELVENSIDASATAVTVEIAGGGSDFIRVTDDGRGIPKDQVELAFYPHATSKIESAEDLSDIKSLGFRGEALSSISAVSRLTMTTKPREDLTGVQCVLDGGKVISSEEIGTPGGTTIIVRDLFFNVPARRKFLRSHITEAGAITDMMEQLSLSRPDISFKYIINKKQRFATPGNGNLKEIIYRLYGKEISENILFIDKYEIPEIGAVTGYIGNPNVDRGTRGFMHFFINGRYLKDEHLQKGLEDAFRPYMMQHRFPFCVLHLTIPPDTVDVNVHPSKLQVHFSDPAGIRRLVYESAEKALKSKESLVDVDFFKKEERQREERELASINSIAAPEPFETAKRAETHTCLNSETEGEWDIDFVEDRPIVKAAVLNDGTEAVLNDGTEAVLNDGTEAVLNDATEADRSDNADVYSSSSAGSKASISQLHDDLFASKTEHTSAKAPDLYLEPRITDSSQLDLFSEKLIDPGLRYQYRIVGQVFDTYYLIEYNDELLIMDQHAAHEKVKYESLIKKLKETIPDTIEVNPPVLVELPGALSAVYESYSDYFGRLGFETEEFGDSSYAIRRVPLELFGKAPGELFLEIVYELSEGGMPTVPDVILSRMASAACKAAVKGNNALTLKEAEALLSQLLTLDNPYNCPHGRPTIIKMSKKELEKRFKRIV